MDAYFGNNYQRATKNIHQAGQHRVQLNRLLFDGSSCGADRDPLHLALDATLVHRVCK